ncbi:hypothetical protein [Specibacter sp. NPDC078692]|uniref:hypothetical protein n=1 Tax=Specibacter sp. NPDC078692 TaxID=3155818 RepID=UPI0034400268
MFVELRELEIRGDRVGMLAGLWANFTLEASQCRAYDFYRCIGMVDDISAVALKGQHIFNELRYLAWLAEGSGGL